LWKEVVIMATTKKTGKAKGAVRRAGGRAKKAMHHRPKLKNHAGTIAGVVITAGELVFNTADTGSGKGRSASTWMMDKSQTMTNRVKYAGDCVASNAKDFGTYVPLGIGLLISASPKIPVLKVVAKPLDQMLRGATHGHTGL
jgi:hypothetical protein